MLAAPADRVPVPRVTLLPPKVSMKVTVPVGVPVPDVGATLVLSVTDCPNVVNVGFAVSPVVVGVPDAETVTVTGCEVLPLWVESLTYGAVTEGDPGASVLVV